MDWLIGRMVICSPGAAVKSSWLVLEDIDPWILRRDTHIVEILSEWIISCYWIC